MSELSPTADEPPPGHDPYAALRVRDFRFFWGGNFIALLGMQMQFAAVLWEINLRTGSAFALGLVGLVQVIPVVSLALVAGHVADRFNRKYIVMISSLVIAAAAVGLLLVSLIRDEWLSVVCMFGLLFITGIARAFQQPAKSSLMPQLVPRNRFTNAITWSAMAFQLASVLGPAAGGLLIGACGGPLPVFVCHAAFALAFCGLLTQVRHQREATEQEPITLENLMAGVNFVRQNRLILSAISLDMFAVLLGGAVALLPIYAKQILEVGPTGYGWLRAAPAIGALLMSLIMAKLPPMKHAGRNLLFSIAGFGVATIAFGLSRSFPLSFALLFLTGVFDNVSVVVRHSLVQLLTPDAMRGRVSAINGMFISISNEVGDFEAGSVAALFTPVISVVSGGIGTLVVVAITACRVPELRRYGRLDSLAPENLEEAGTSTEAEAQSV